MNEDIAQDEQELSEAENVSSIEAELESLRKQVKTVTADFYNYRQRTSKEKLETRKRAQEDVIISMLPVIDNLDRALEASGTDDTASLIKGVDMVRRQFIGVLESLGVSQIKTDGAEFDPSLHEASGTEKVDDPNLDGKVITEMLKGYRTKEHVLRPAQVIVGKK